MKNLKVTLGTCALVLSLFTSCEKTSNDTVDITVPPTAAEFGAIRATALANRTQNFQFNAETMGSFISTNGVEYRMNGFCLTKNGDSVTGMVDIEVVEIFERGDMLSTNSTTMGRMANGDKALLISGGQFYVNASQDGIDLDISCGFQVLVPTSLTGGDDPLMTLWEGVEECNGLDNGCNIVWEQDEEAANQPLEIGRGGNAGVGAGNIYFTFFQNFGWTNVDRFFSDPRPKTTLLVDVPNGYDNTNSTVYLSYDGEANALANLDTYDSTTGLFSEHYGQIPIGLACHVIFASGKDGVWLYAIKSATITAGGTIVFTEAELDTATDTQLTTLINNLP